MAQVAEFKTPVFVRVAGREIEIGEITVPVVSRSDRDRPGHSVITADVSGLLAQLGGADV